MHVYPVIGTNIVIVMPVAMITGRLSFTDKNVTFLGEIKCLK